MYICTLYIKNNAFFAPWEPIFASLRGNTVPFQNACSIPKLINHFLIYKLLRESESCKFFPNYPPPPIYMYKILYTSRAFIRTSGAHPQTLG